ncbi:MAG: radical SAM family heme chaperone HemW [Cytophagales bacterium]|nr:radical SAM family heme chaperone HemW [Cytophagales bacterium]
MAGLYIHIPFCKQACYYCDFHFSTNTRYTEKMIKAISRELELQASYLDDDRINTIYIGGGTPSILGIAEFEKLFDAVYSHYSTVSNPEITIEANPDDLSYQKLKLFKEFGTNRLSIGIQSFQDRFLEFLNRAHRSQDAIDSFNQARELGFENISIDLIFSIPKQSMTHVEFDISKALELNPEHISIYSLTIENKTVFGNWQQKGKFKTVPEEESARQYDFIISTLEKEKYEQYEISNFCRDNRYSKHNTSYWKNIGYLGVGPGAHSFNGKSRQFNVANNHVYMKSIKEGKVPFEMEVLDQRSLANEYLLTSLRTKWGCDLRKLTKLYSYPIRTHRKRIEQLVAERFIHITENIIYLTRKGKFLADEIIAELLWI